MTGEKRDGDSAAQRQGHTSRGSGHARLHRRRCFTVSTWNVRTLVESAGGDRRICRSRPQPDSSVTSESPAPHLVDRKLDILVKELKRYGVSVAGIQETRWYGKDVWKSDGFTFLHSGRRLPEEGESAVRKEGVGILLDDRATAAWKEAGEAWEAVSSRVITARLKAARAGQRRPGGSKETGNIFFPVISVYAPTAKAPPGIKEKFMDDLQDAIDRTPASDILLLLGDFNARVGKSTADDDEWREVRGGHGVGCCNAAWSFAQ